MSTDDIVRSRLRNHKTENGFGEKIGSAKKERVASLAAGEFCPRESPLTTLISGSPHIRAIYHIFVGILVILFFDTVTFDFFERGKINVGWSTVVAGWGDTGRAVRLWLVEVALALIYYPGLLLYAFGARIFKNWPICTMLWRVLGLVGLVALQTLLCWLPVTALYHTHLAIASAISVVCEMLRIMMKLHAITVAIASRAFLDTSMPSFRHFLYFMFAPTLLYRDHYPRTKQIRWSVVVLHLGEVAAIIFYNSFLWERFILPYWSDYGKQNEVEWGVVVRGMFACVLPGIISFLCGFYCLLHAWLNAWAELLTFADRLFYEEWWTTSQFSRYYRAWNRVVYAWLRTHVYAPLATTPRARVMAAASVFILSAIAHELILALAFGFFYPVLMVMFGGFGALLVPFTATFGSRHPHLFNFLMWLMFLIGNGILWSLYPMEFFARKNCPPSDNDSFFIPKSWSCPRIVLKPDWHFHNPFSSNTNNQ